MVVNHHQMTIYSGDVKTDPFLLRIVQCAVVVKHG